MGKYVEVQCRSSRPRVDRSSINSMTLMEGEKLTEEERVWMTAMLPAT